ncbi:MAG: hypothetical protein V9E88_03060 [Ferruginibacter sp.]
MSGIKKLAGQTLWYGIPTIASRFLGYLMNMALPFFIALPEKTADLVQVYTLIPFLNVLYSYGMETAYFRFSQTHDRQKLYNTLSVSLFFSTILFSLVLWLCKDSLMHAADLEKHPEYILVDDQHHCSRQPQHIAFCKTPAGEQAKDVCLCQDCRNHYQSQCGYFIHWCDSISI